MRKTTEPGNDIAVQFGVVHVIVVADALRHQFHAKLLIVQVFAMFERHVIEQPPVGRLLHIETGVDCIARDFKRFGVAGIGSCIVPVEIARHLVEQNDQCQATVGRAPP
jgi:hypothetical protein